MLNGGFLEQYHHNLPLNKQWKDDTLVYLPKCILMQLIAAMLPAVMPMAKSVLAAAVAAIACCVLLAALCRSRRQQKVTFKQIFCRKIYAKSP